MENNYKEFLDEFEKIKIMKTMDIYK